MRTIGLLGGMSWESSSEYYRVLNEAIRDRLGGLHSAECVMWSVDFAPIEELQRTGDWDEAARRLAALARRLEQAGAECLVLCTNTMHRLADEVQGAIDIPLLHIADATAARVKSAGVDRVGLLATRYTMTQDFYGGRLAERHGLEVLVPPEPDLSLVHDVIYQELCRGLVSDGSRDAYRRVISELEEAGAEGIIYGCTEIDLLVGPQDASVPVFDSTRIHVETAVEWALAPADPPDVTLRRATGGDAQAIGAVFDAAVQGGWTFLGELAQRPMFSAQEWDELVESYAPPNALLVAAAEPDGVVGFTAVDAGKGEMFLLFVDPAHANRGVGGVLLGAAHDVLRQAGHREAFLFTEERNQRAIAVYEAAGYRPDGSTRESDFHGEPLRELRLVKPL